MRRHALRPVYAAALALVAALVLHAPRAWSQSMTGPIAALRGAPAPRARVRAVQEIARTRPAGSREALEAALRDRAPGVRRAAAITLGELGDRGAVPALNGVLNDRDRNVRAAVQASVRSLSLLPAQPAGAFGSVAPAAAPAAAPAPVDWRRVRMVVSINNLTNRASSSAADLEVMRQTLRRAVESAPGLALHTGALPAVAQARLRARTLRWCSLEGSLTSLQRTQDASGVRVRAALSLAILQEPAHNIIGSVETSASAMEQVYPGGTEPGPRLSRAAIEVASRGAIQRVQEQFGATTAPPAGRRRRGR
jgi:hypothetical protein